MNAVQCIMWRTHALNRRFRENFLRHNHRSAPPPPPPPLQFRDYLLPPRLPLFSCIGIRARIASKERLIIVVSYLPTHGYSRTREHHPTINWIMKLTSLLLQRAAPPLRYDREKSRQGQRYPRVKLSFLRKNSGVARTRAFTVHPVKTKQNKTVSWTQQPQGQVGRFVRTLHNASYPSKLCRQAAEGTKRDIFHSVVPTTEPRTGPAKQMQLRPHCCSSEQRSKERSQPFKRFPPPSKTKVCTT